MEKKKPQIISDEMSVDLAGTKELIKDLFEKTGQQVTIENVTDYLLKNTIIVRAHIGRSRSYVPLNPKSLGLDDEDEDMKEFFQKHVKLGRLSIIPENYQKQLTSIDSRLRRVIKNNAIGYQDSAVTVEAFEEIAKCFEEGKKEYFELRDEIVDNYETIVSDSLKTIHASLDRLGASNVDKLMDAISNSVIPKDVYKNSFYFDLETRMFPISQNIEYFPKDIQSQLKDSDKKATLEMVEEITVGALNDVFEVVGSMMKSYQTNGWLAGRTKEGLKNCAKMVKTKNILGNKKVEEIGELVRSIILAGELDEKMEIAEGILAEIFVYAETIGFDQKLNFAEVPYSKQDLRDIHEFRQESSPKDENSSDIFNIEDVLDSEVKERALA